MNNTLKGMTMAGLAAVFWGSMGVAGQYLLQNCHFTPMDLISIRMLLAGRTDAPEIEQRTTI